MLPFPPSLPSFSPPPSPAGLCGPLGPCGEGGVKSVEGGEVKMLSGGRGAWGKNLGLSVEK